MECNSTSAVAITHHFVERMVRLFIFHHPEFHKQFQTACGHAAITGRMVYMLLRTFWTGCLTVQHEPWSCSSKCIKAGFGGHEMLRLTFGDWSTIVPVATRLWRPTIKEQGAGSLRDCARELQLLIACSLSLGAPASTCLD